MTTRLTFSRSDRYEVCVVVLYSLLWMNEYDWSVWVLAFEHGFYHIWKPHYCLSTVSDNTHLICFLKCHFICLLLDKKIEAVMFTKIFHLYSTFSLYSWPASFLSPSLRLFWLLSSFQLNICGNGWCALVSSTSFDFPVQWEWNFKGYGCNV